MTEGKSLPPYLQGIRDEYRKKHSNDPILAHHFERLENDANTEQVLNDVSEIVNELDPSQNKGNIEGTKQPKETALNIFNRLKEILAPATFDELEESFVDDAKKPELSGRVSIESLSPEWQSVIKILTNLSGYDGKELQKKLAEVIPGSTLPISLTHIIDDGILVNRITPSMDITNEHTFWNFPKFYDLFQYTLVKANPKAIEQMLENILVNQGEKITGVSIFENLIFGKFYGKDSGDKYSQQDNDQITDSDIDVIKRAIDADPNAAWLFFFCLLKMPARFVGNSFVAVEDQNSDWHKVVKKYLASDTSAKIVLNPQFHQFLEKCLYDPMLSLHTIHYGSRQASSSSRGTLAVIAKELRPDLTLPEVTEVKEKNFERPVGLSRQLKMFLFRFSADVQSFLNSLEINSMSPQKEIEELRSKVLPIEADILDDEDFGGKESKKRVKDLMSQLFEQLELEPEQARKTINELEVLSMR